MKKYIPLYAAVIIIFSILIAAKPVISSIYGAIEPPEGALKVLAIKEKDTIAVIPHDGKFSIKVTGGTWKLYFVAAHPYKDKMVENIAVQDNLSTDAGFITLSKD